MVAGTLLFASCSNDENTPLPDGTSGEVPALVLDEFNSLFPGATNVVWSTKGEYAVASFYWEIVQIMSFVTILLGLHWQMEYGV